MLLASLGDRSATAATLAATPATAATPQPPRKVRGRDAAVVPQASAVVAPSATIAAPPAVAGAPSAAPQATTKVFLPLVVKPDTFADWVNLGKPAAGASVNYVYVSQACGARLPSSILAGTDKGLYSYDGAWHLNANLGASIEVSHIFDAGADGLFVASFAQGLWRSPNGGATWEQVALPIADTRLFWIAASNNYLYAAGSQGLYRASRAGGSWIRLRGGTYYSVATSGSKVFAAQVLSANDVLLISADDGDTWPVAQALPGTVDGVQTLDTAQGSPQLLIGAVRGGLFTLDGANNIVPFSQGVSESVFGIWRDGQGRIYTALDIPGGLKRFAPAGGAPSDDLSALPGGGSLTDQAFFAINGSAICKIAVLGTELGDVWARRVP
jgi:hypothetical protein